MSDLKGEKIKEEKEEDEKGNQFLFIFILFIVSLISSIAFICSKITSFQRHLVSLPLSVTVTRSKADPSVKEKERPGIKIEAL